MRKANFLKNKIYCEFDDDDELHLDKDWVENVVLDHLLWTKSFRVNKGNANTLFFFIRIYFIRISINIEAEICDILKIF